MRERQNNDHVTAPKKRYVTPKNCERLTETRVYPSVWNNLSETPRSTNIKVQKLQNLLIESMVIVAIAVNNLATTAGDDESGIEGLSAQNNAHAEILMDAMAMLATANLEVSVRQEASKP